MTDLHSMYPALAQHISQSMSNELIKKKDIPFNKRAAMSLLIGGHLDGAFNPDNLRMSIQANGIARAQSQAQNQVKSPKGNLGVLAKFASTEATPLQSHMMGLES